MVFLNKPVLNILIVKYLHVYEDRHEETIYIYLLNFSSKHYTIFKQSSQWEKKCITVLRTRLA